MNQDFIKEDIKKRPVNKAKILRKTLTTIALAIVFGVVASLVILVLEPYLEKITTKTNEPVPEIVSLPEDEMSPEEMLSEYMMQESALAEMMAEENAEAEAEAEETDPVELPLSEDQVNAILSKVRLDATSYRQIMMSMSAYARDLGMYVVNVTAVRSSIDWLNSVNDRKDSTAGLIIAENNIELLILADSKALSNADTLKVAFKDGRSVPAQIKSADTVTGLAIVAVNLSEIPQDIDVSTIIAKLGNSNSLYVGSPIVAIGSPKGNFGSIGYGIVDAPKTSISLADTHLNLFTTDILGSRNSSGVVFNLQGQAIGFITESQAETGENVVVNVYGITELRDTIEKLSNAEDFGYLGITGTDVTSQANAELGVPMGAYVTKTDMDSPAMQSGVLVGDVITGIDDQHVSYYSEYVSIIQKCKPDDEIVMHIMRKSQDEYVGIDITLTVGRRGE